MGVKLLFVPSNGMVNWKGIVGHLDLEMLWLGREREGGGERDFIGTEKC